VVGKHLQCAAVPLVATGHHSTCSTLPFNLPALLGFMFIRNAHITTQPAFHFSDWLLKARQCVHALRTI